MNMKQNISKCVSFVQNSEEIMKLSGRRIEFASKIDSERVRCFGTICDMRPYNVCIFGVYNRFSSFLCFVVVRVPFSVLHLKSWNDFTLLLYFMTNIWIIQLFASCSFDLAKRFYDYVCMCGVRVEESPCLIFWKRNSSSDLTDDGFFLLLFDVQFEQKKYEHIYLVNEHRASWAHSKRNETKFLYFPGEWLTLFGEKINSKQKYK